MYPPVMFRARAGSGQLFLHEGDLTTFEADAIVNAANSRLAGGGGVDGAIHHAAGLQELQRACAATIAEIGSLPAGEAVITPGFNLPARFIIHTVGPVWHGGTSREPELLRNAYLNSLKLAHEHGLHTVAFPAISCGVYGYPVAQAARVALEALRQGLEDGFVKEAGMVLHGKNAWDVWSAAANKLL
ncbi:macro domain-containing protein [Pseudodesulfovibrio sp.]|uniref:macro domain-containing protein n=1 Tax=unclassified Pseudodesulfovibrio TaxID=2661612 RepID=UPI003B00ED56